MMRRMEDHDAAEDYDDDDDDGDDDDAEDYDDDNDNDNDDVSGKQVGTDQSRATFRAKQGSSTSPVDTMI